MELLTICVENITQVFQKDSFYLHNYIFSDIDVLCIFNNYYDNKCGENIPGD